MPIRMLRFFAGFLLSALLVVHGVAGQATESIPAVVFERLDVYAGPGDTYGIVAELGAGVPVEVHERNPIGTWVHISRAAGDGMEAIDGWVLSGYLTLPDDFVMTDLPVNAELADAITDDIPDADIVRLYDTPIIPQLSDAMIEVFERGQELGNQADVVSKVGDSNSANGRYLKPIAAGQYDLGPYTYLAETVSYYGASFGNPNIATRIGLNAYSVFDPLWSNPVHCEPDETPLHCEYRHNKPAIAVILFGQNDTRVLNSEQFEAQIRRVIEESIEMGVIPLLLTFSSDDDADIWFQAVRFNVILIELAEEYEIPLLNFWSAARVLPNRGIGDDNAHLTGGADAVNLIGRESRDGVPLLNLTVLYSLDQIRRSLPEPSSESA